MRTVRCNATDAMIYAINDEHTARCVRIAQHTRRPRKLGLRRRSVGVTAHARANRSDERAYVICNEHSAARRTRASIENMHDVAIVIAQYEAVRSAPFACHALAARNSGDKRALPNPR